MKLEIRQGKKVRRVRTDESIVTIGSTPGSLLRLTGSRVPPHLAELRRTPTGLKLARMAQETGVMLDGVYVVGSADIEVGAVVSFDCSNLRFRVLEDTPRSVGPGKLPWRHPIPAAIAAGATLVLVLLVYVLFLSSGESGPASQGAGSGDIPLQGPRSVPGLDDDIDLAPSPFPEVDSHAATQLPPYDEEVPPRADPLEMARRASVGLVAIDQNGGITSRGSGVVLDSSHVITNKHVIQNSTMPLVVVRDPSTEKQLLLCGQVCHVAETLDLAIIRVQLPHWVLPAKLATSEPRVGERVLAIGSPLGFSDTVTDGLVSAIRVHEKVRYIQTSAPISPGSSGGGLFSERGTLLGLTALKARTQGAEGLAFAISVDAFRKVIRNPGAFQAMTQKELGDLWGMEEPGSPTNPLGNASAIVDLVSDYLWLRYPHPVRSANYTPSVSRVTYDMHLYPSANKGDVVFALNGNTLGRGYAFRPFKYGEPRAGMVGYAGTGHFRSASGHRFDTSRSPVSSLKSFWVLTAADQEEIHAEVRAKWSEILDVLSPSNKGFLLSYIDGCVDRLLEAMKEREWPVFKK